MGRTGGREGEREREREREMKEGRLLLQVLIGVVMVTAEHAIMNTF